MMRVGRNKPWSLEGPRIMPLEAWSQKAWFLGFRLGRFLQSLFGFHLAWTVKPNFVWTLGSIPFERQICLKLSLRI